MKKIIIFSFFICISLSAQNDVDTLRLFPDTTTFKNESVFITEFISQFAVKFDVEASWTNYSIEEIRVLLVDSEYLPWDSTQHFASFGLALNLYDTTIFVERISVDSVVFPEWRSIKIEPPISIDNDNSFFIGGELLFYLALSHNQSDTLNGNQYTYYSNNEKWSEGLPFFFPIKVIIKRSAPNKISKDRDSIESGIVFPNYPNPFNPETKLSFFLESNSNVSIDLFDPLGRFIKNIRNGHQNAGLHEIIVNFNSITPEVGSGVYFCRFIINNQVKTLSILLLK
ncbi:MAG: T9SS type A sorting domain-containing protein [Melioribacteraceae bacterium]|nr:T9SS type A sorting domain-containing protein [Melioribacteraceae bacterium]MCF8263442.1 T9SS type A sorting domain-containing protein [Melioribacteraceae bacterium]MCF8432083.1 T9SS type A sorting domain-containing protein [Melioribacteraceae bacterium]